MQRIRGMIVVICAALIAACSPATAPVASPAAQSSAVAAGSSSPSSAAPVSSAPTQAQPSPAPPETAAPRPTDAPAAPPGLTLWYSYAEGSPEEQALLALADQSRPNLADTNITLLRVAGDELINRFETESVAGGGPDLLLMTNESLGRDVRAGLLRNIDSAVANVNLDAASLESMRVDGKLYGLLLTRSTVALYSNTTNLPTPPTTTQALLDAVKSGTKAVFIRSAFHNFGFFGAFGGRLLDESGRCVADQGGFAEALAYLRELKAAGAQFVPSGREAQELFRSGQADLTIDGDWLLADFRASLGDQLAVAPLPAGPAGPARPLVDSSGISISANSQHEAAAVALALALTNDAAQQQITSRTQLIPASPQITPSDAAIAAFASSAQNGVPRPQLRELDAFWQPFDAALSEVLETDADPVQVVQTACAAMNSANGK